MIILGEKYCNNTVQVPQILCCREYISFLQDVSPANVRSIATPSPFLSFGTSAPPKTTLTIRVVVMLHTSLYFGYSYCNLFLLHSMYSFGK